jgi:hypothetical protein
VIIIAPDDHIPLVEEDLAFGPNQNLRGSPLGSTRNAVAIDVVGTISYGAEAVDPKAVIVVIAPICMIVASALS